MAKITVLGGTGYVGSHIVAAGTRRGHTVTAYARKAPADGAANVTWKIGSAFDAKTLDAVFEGADIVVSALSPRGELAGKMLDVVRELEKRSAASHVRLGIIGGAGSLHVAPGGPKFVDLKEFPEAYKAEALEMAAVLDLLQKGESENWFYVSPPPGFGSFAPGTFTGKYRLGDDVVVGGPHATISGADLADAVITEIETNAHPGKRFTLAY